MSRSKHPWEHSYAEDVSWDVHIRPSTISALFSKSVRQFAGRTMMEFYGRQISYRELGGHVQRMARALTKHGVRQGDVVALYCANTPFHPVVFFAAMQIGAIVTHLTPLDAPRERSFKLEDSGARTLVAIRSEGFFPDIDSLARSGGLDRIFYGDDAFWRAPTPVTADGEPTESSAISIPAILRGVETDAPEPDPDQATPDDIALLQYTGGTTGAPKGAMLTHANLTATVEMFNHWMSGEPYWNPDGERHVGVLPLFHIYALATILLRAVSRGDLIILRTKFDAAQVLQDISELRATWFFGVPTMFTALAAHPDADSYDLGSLKLCVSGGAPLPHEVAERFKRVTGFPVASGWGMTETCGAGTMTRSVGEPPAGALGYPLPNVEIDIVDLEDPTCVLPANQVGEIRIRGPNVMRGYWRRSSETSAAFSDGALLTGDIGVMDEAGLVTLVDRKKDMIISGGYNVYPRAIEEAIYEHPDVEEVLVYGIPHSYRGEATKAAIKLREGAASFDLETLRAFLADRLGKHELPAAIEFFDHLPRTAVGKLSKKELAHRDREAFSHRAG